MDMIDVTTKSGFHCRVNPQVLDDWRVVEALAEAGDDNPLKQADGSVKVLKIVFGDKNIEALKKHVAETNGGFVSTEKMVEELFDVFGACGKAEKK